jgi:hypothetical protein
MPLPPSPLKLAHRNPSMIDESPISPGTGVNGFAPQSPLEPQTPRLSAPPSPVTPRQNLHTMAGSQRESVDFSADAGGGGLGNLADELADAWEQEDEGYDYTSGQETGAAGSQPMDQSDGDRPIRPRPGAGSDPINFDTVGRNLITTGPTMGTTRTLKKRPIFPPH